MSWDLVVFAADTPTTSDETGAATFAEDWQPTDIGSSSALRHSIASVFPAAGWNDATWGHVEGEAFSLEFSFGAEGPVSSFTIHARGDATPALMQLSAATGWRILDTTTMKWLNDAADPDEGRRQFQTFRDQVIPLAPKPAKRGLLRWLFG